MLVSEVQPEKACFFMLVTLLGIVTESNLLQFINASLPIEVTLSGIINSLISAPTVSINWTGFPMLALIVDKMLWLQKEEKSVTRTFMLTSSEQPIKADLPNSYKSAGSVTDANSLQSANAPSDMYVLLFRIVTEINPPQPLNVSSPIPLTLLGITISLTSSSPMYRWCAYVKGLAKLL